MYKGPVCWVEVPTNATASCALPNSKPKNEIGRIFTARHQRGCEDLRSEIQNHAHLCNSCVKRLSQPLAYPFLKARFCNVICAFVLDKQYTTYAKSKRIQRTGLRLERSSMVIMGCFEILVEGTGIDYRSNNGVPVSSTCG